MSRVCAVEGVNLRDYSRTAAQRGWGSGWPSCQGVKDFKTVLITADTSKTRVTVNARIGRLVDLLMDTTERRGYLFKPKSTGGYNCRPIGGTSRPSNHSWALAVDANWNDNPYTTTGKHDIPDWVYDLWARYGFANGGDYSGAKKDWMHFEFMGTPEQADRATELAYRELVVPAVMAEKPKELDKMANGILPAARDGEFFFQVHAGDASALVSECWVSMSSRLGVSGRWRWVRNDQPVGDYIEFKGRPYGQAWASSSKESRVKGVTGIEGYYTSDSPVGWEIEKKPR